jgi:aminoglycoside phosphotransferase (APT) family kinase protein
MADATTIAEFSGRLESYLSQVTGGKATLTSLTRLTGGASRDTWSLDAKIEDGVDAGPQHLVLRRDMGGEIQPNALSRRHEFEILQVMWKAGVLVPRPRWLCEDPAVLGLPFFLMDRVEGESVGRRIVRDKNLASARALLPVQMGEHLARIHAVDAHASGLTFLPTPTDTPSPADRAVASALEQLDELNEPHPVLEWALRWLERHAPPCPCFVTVHGDFRIGNLMVGSEGLRGIFDWEFCHIGDPAEDLSWPCVRSWRFGQDDLRLGGVGDFDGFYTAYRAAGGLEVEPASVRFWEIMGNVRWAIGCISQASRHLSGQARSVELASLGRRSAEMEAELLNLIDEELATSSRAGI